MPVQITTTLPDEDQPVLGNAVEGEVAIGRETAVTNYGDVRLQIRETGEPSWDSNATGFAEQTVAYDTLTTIFAGREGGKEYEVRGRSETEHVTGAWTTPVAIVTKFPGPTNLTVDATGATTVDLSWTDNAVAEDGFRLRRRRDYDGEWGPWRAVDTVGPNTESTTDDTLSPGRTYQFEVVAFAEDAEAASNRIQTTTTSSGAGQRRIAAGDTRVEIEHPDVDQPLSPTPLDDVTWKPTLNGPPQVDIPVRYDEKWLAGAFDDAPMRVWLEGDRLPIDKLKTVRTQPDRMVLIGSVDLDTRVENKEVSEQEAHKTAEDVINLTPYDADVDEPDVTVETRTAQTADSETEWTANLPAIPDDKPLEITPSGTLKQQQTLFWAEAEDEWDVDSQTETLFLDPDASGEYGEQLTDAIHDVEYTATFDHSPPNGLVAGARVRSGESAESPGFEIYLDGSEVFSAGANGIAGSTDFSYLVGTDSNATSAGEHTVRISITNASAPEGIIVDGLFLYDPDHHHFGNFADSVGPGGYLNLGDNGNYPGLVRQETQDATFAEQVVGGSLTAAFNNTGGQQEAAISQDRGQNWTVAQNSESVSKNWGQGTPQIRARFGLSSWGTQDNETPTQGHLPQEVDLYTLDADFDSTPLLVDRAFDAPAGSVLREIADYAQSLWELRWDKASESIVIVWTQPGQRTSDADPEIISYDVDKSTENQATKVVIKGASAPVSGSQFTADHGTAQELAAQTIQTGSEAVIDPSDRTQFERGADYSMDYGAPATITTLSGGSMTDGQTYEIGYDKQSEGEYAVPEHDPSTDEPLVRTIPAATSNRECEQAATYLANELKDPIFSASVTLSRLDAGLSLVDDVDFDGLPDRVERMEVRSVEQAPESVTLQLGSRPPLQELLSRYGSRIGAAEKRL